MWTTIALCGAGLVLALAVIYGAVWIGKRWGKSEVRQAIAEDEAEIDPTNGTIYVSDNVPLSKIQKLWQYGFLTKCSEKA